MTTYLPRLLGAVALACGLAWAGLPSSGKDVLPVGAAEARPATDVEARANQLALNAVEDPPPGGETPRAASSPAARLADGIRADTAGAVARLAESLKKNPAELTPYRGYGAQVYMLDLVDGGFTLVADEALPGKVANGVPRWSHDGTRIVFDECGDDWPLGNLILIEARDGKPTYTDLGPGRNPSWSPDDKRIAFALQPGAVPDAEPGIWLMQADGSRRRRVGEFGTPFWSPDGGEFLINSESVPTKSTVINLETGEGADVKVAGREIFSWPNWAGPSLLVSALATNGESDAIVLLDVREPSEARIVNVLWERGNGLDVIPRWPAYQPTTRRCYFVGEEPGKRTLYWVRRGESLTATPMNVVEHQGQARQTHFSGLSFSPDGRYLLFIANRPTRE